MIKFRTSLSNQPGTSTRSPLNKEIPFKTSSFSIPSLVNKDHSCYANHSVAVQTPSNSTKTSFLVAPNLKNMSLEPGMTFDFLDFINSNHHHNDVFETNSITNTLSNEGEHKFIQEPKKDQQNPLSSPLKNSLHKNTSMIIKNKSPSFYISNIIQPSSKEQTNLTPQSNYLPCNDAMNNQKRLVTYSERIKDTEGPTTKLYTDGDAEEEEEEDQPGNAKKKLKSNTLREHNSVAQKDDKECILSETQYSPLSFAANKRNKVIFKKNNKSIRRSRNDLDLYNVEVLLDFNDSKPLEKGTNILYEEDEQDTKMKDFEEISRTTFSSSNENNVLQLFKPNFNVLTNNIHKSVLPNDEISRSNFGSSSSSSNSVGSCLLNNEFNRETVCLSKKNDIPIDSVLAKDNCSSNMNVEEDTYEKDLTTINTIELYNCTQNHSFATNNNLDRNIVEEMREIQPKRNWEFPGYKVNILRQVVEEKMEVDSNAGDEKMDISEDSEDNLKRCPDSSSTTENIWEIKFRNNLNQERMMDDQISEYSNQEMEEVDDDEKDEVKDEINPTELRLRPRKFRSCFMIKERRSRALLKQRSRVLGRWFVKHFAHPYPSKMEKDELAKETNMSRNQVSEWFGNMRRRIREASKGQQMTWEERVRNYNDLISGKSDPLPIMPGDLLSFNNNLDKDTTGGAIQENLNNPSSASLTSKFKQKLLQRYMSDSTNMNDITTSRLTVANETAQTVINIANNSDYSNNDPQYFTKLNSCPNNNTFQCDSTATPNLNKTKYSQSMWKNLMRNGINYDYQKQIFLLNKNSSNENINMDKTLKCDRQITLNYPGTNANLKSTTNLGEFVRTHKTYSGPTIKKQKLTPYSYVGFTNVREKSKDMNRSSDEIAAAYSLMDLQKM